MSHCSGADLLAAARLDGCRCHQIRESARRRDARAASRRAERRQPVFHDAQLQQASITVTHEDRRGQQVFVDLLKKCDIIMENFGPGVLDRFGFTWEKIHELNPKIVMGSIKGFGSTGPRRPLQGLRERRQAMGGGAMSTTGRPDGHPSSPARRSRLGHGPAPRDRTARGATPGEHHRQGPVRGSGDDDGVMNLCGSIRDHQRLTRQSSPNTRCRLPGHGRRAARRQDSGGGSSATPSTASRTRERLALRRGAGGRMGRSREAHRAGSGRVRSRDRPAWRASAERRKNQQLGVDAAQQVRQKYTKRDLMAISTSRRSLRPIMVDPGPCYRRPREGRDMWVGSTTRTRQVVQRRHGRSSSPIRRRIEPRRSWASTPDEVLKEVLLLRRREDRRLKQGWRLLGPPKRRIAVKIAIIGSRTS